MPVCDAAPVSATPLPPLPAGIEIRVADPSKHELIGELTAEAYREHGVGEAYLEQVRDVGRRAAEAVVLVAVTPEGAVAGAVTYVPGPGPYATFDDDREAGIRMLAVAPGWRRRGVGRALVQACVARARAEGRARLSLHTMTTMTAAHELYRALGFRRAPEIDDQVTPEVLLLGYVLDL